MGLAIDNKLNEHPVLHAFMWVLLSFFVPGGDLGGQLGRLMSSTVMLLIVLEHAHCKFQHVSNQF